MFQISFSVVETWTQLAEDVCVISGTWSEDSSAAVSYVPVLQEVDGDLAVCVALDGGRQVKVYRYCGCVLSRCYSLLFQLWLGYIGWWLSRLGSIRRIPSTGVTKWSGWRE